MPFISKIQLPSGTTYDIRATNSINYIIAYKSGLPTSEILANVPDVITISYSGEDYHGTLAASADTYGSIYLVKSDSQNSDNDYYDEWITVDNGESASTRYEWEKLGDTRISIDDLTITKKYLHTGTFVTGYSNPITDEVLGSGTGFLVSPPIVTISGNTTGDVEVATGIGNATTKYLSASSSITGKTTNVATSVTPTTAKLATTTITGINGTTSINVVKTRSSQTTNDGTWTALPSSTTDVNDNLLAGISVSNDTLIIGAASLDTQTTYSAGTPESTSFVKAATSATTVATGSTTSSGSGADIVTNVAVGDTVAAVTSAPDITLTANSSAGAGRITYVQAQGTTTTTKLSASASGGSVAPDFEDNVNALTGLGTASTGSAFNALNTTSSNDEVVTDVTPQNAGGNGGSQTSGPSVS